MVKNNTQTSWGNVADWYDDYLENNQDTYQVKVIWPNLLRLLEIKSGEKILDLACGSGFFSREIAKQNKNLEITGVDVSPELIKLAQENSRDFKNIKYLVASAEGLTNLENNYFDKIICVLALQNIENVKLVFAEINRVVKSSGKIILVLNHPAFRIPGASSWLWDDVSKRQARRLDKYLSESKSEILMHPGKAENSEKTVSFHRPLQHYFKLIASAGLAVTRLEEWISHKSSETGPRKIAEDQARHEFPLFLCLEIKKL